MEFLRAQTRLQDLQTAFSDHMTREVQPLLDDTDRCTPRMQGAVDLLLGKRRLYYPEPRHIMVPDLPIHEFYPRDHFPWLEELESKTSVILDELNALITHGTSFDPYLTKSNERPVFDTHGMAGNDDWGAFYFGKTVRQFPRIRRFARKPPRP